MRLGKFFAVLLLGFGCLWLNGESSVGSQEPGSSKKIEARGKLRTGIVAIGGETTGIILVTKEGKMELDLGKKKELRDLAEKLDGKNVIATGTLQIRKGVEIRQRTILIVDTLKAAEGK